ncbi:uncharacterized protein I303_107022 [Kwoniella dejecticola CBS 10117]|uniref:Uncharacterized protein n=1 Tax=Kwoniella dejecticola CBS 10117 TaxID=1296121 RepID=A0A1A5ZYH5_9TREE|nr:uncharacterized protein I303_06423 [Kwoniella dejecticola CBS 10117]OBR82866.1 hypothetical protein I303_06423 [Kwoniella dejecticola CBS 10117]
MAPIIRPRQPHSLVQTENATSDVLLPTQTHNSSPGSYVASNHYSPRKQRRISRTQQYQQYQQSPSIHVRQLSLDVSTPSRTATLTQDPKSISNSNGAAATTRRLANPTATDLTDSPASAAQAIRTTRLDNPPAVANLDLGTSSSSPSPSSSNPSRTQNQNQDEEQETETDSATSFTRTTTIHSSASASASRTNNNIKAPSFSSSSTETEGSILAQAVATSNISWWQLLAIIVCGVVALSVGAWLFFRSRQRKRYKKKEKKKQDIEEKMKEKERTERELDMLKGFGHSRRDRAGRRGKGGRGGRGGRYDDDAESDSQDYSDDDDETISSSRSRRHRYRQRRGGRARRERGRGGRYRDREFSEDDESDYTRERREKEGYTPKSAFSVRPSASASASASRSPKSALSRKKSFRDSVFSTYNSMKKAAVRLKYVEAKVKLDQQLEEEERLERERKEKIKEANREIEDYNRGREVERQNTQANTNSNTNMNTMNTYGNGGWGNNQVEENQQGQVPDSDPVYNRNQNQYPNHNRNQHPQAPNQEQRWNSNSHDQEVERPRGKLLIPPVPRQAQPSKTHSAEIPTAALLPYHTSSSRSRSESLDGEISNLLGGNPKSKARANSTSSSSTSASPSADSKVERPAFKRQETSKVDKRKGLLASPIPSQNQSSISITKPEPIYALPRDRSQAYANMKMDMSMDDDADSDSSDDEEGYYPSQGQHRRPVQAGTSNQGGNAKDLKAGKSNLLASTLGFGDSSNANTNASANPSQRSQEPKKGYTNPFNTDWLSVGRPIQASPTEIDTNFKSSSNSDADSYLVGKQASSRLPITHPNENPVVPRSTHFGGGGFRSDTAGPVSLRGKGSVGFGVNPGDRQGTGVGSGSGAGAGNKWANRLRERK